MSQTATHSCPYFAQKPFWLPRGVMERFCAFVLSLGQCWDGWQAESQLLSRVFWPSSAARVVPANRHGRGTQRSRRLEVIFAVAVVIYRTLKEARSLDALAESEILVCIPSSSHLPDGRSGMRTGLPSHGGELSWAQDRSRHCKTAFLHLAARHHSKPSAPVRRRSWAVGQALAR